MSSRNDTALALLFGALFLSFTMAVSAWVIMVLWGALASFFGFTTIPYEIAVLITLALTVIRIGSKA